MGYNFLLSDWYHLGLNVRTAAPTGTLRTSEFLFEPIAGNNHHWELWAADLTGHVDLWCDDEHRQKFGIYSDLNITHLFASSQKRSFDLQTTCTIPSNGSRYMLP